VMACFQSVRHMTQIANMSATVSNSVGSA